MAEEILSREVWLHVKEIGVLVIVNGLDQRVNRYAKEHLMYVFYFLCFEC